MKALWKEWTCSRQTNGANRQLQAQREASPPGRRACPARLNQPLLRPQSGLAATAAGAAEGQKPLLSMLQAAGLPSVPDLEGQNPRTKFNAVTLAYMGDAIWELLLRKHIINQGTHRVGEGIHAYEEAKVLAPAAAAYANAWQQAQYFDWLLESSKAVGAGAAAGVSTATGTSGAGSPAQPAQPAVTDPLGSVGSGLEEEGPDSSAAALSASISAVDQSFALTAEEVDVLRWARNSSAVSPPKNVDSRMYKKATALEALVAYLYLTDPERCMQLVTGLLATPLSKKEQPES